MPDSIMNARDEHRRWCHNADGGWLGEMGEWSDLQFLDSPVRTHFWYRPGDVRRCVHDRIMLAVEEVGVGGAMGWRTLSPIWNPFLFLRARKVLDANS